MQMMRIAHERIKAISYNSLNVGQKIRIGRNSFAEYDLFLKRVSALSPPLKPLL